ncbi:MAG: acetylornithine carbamoyltransferase [Bacteroidota bacterium]|jgi:N-succinyl-L-ornithine transcarbamylase|nr:acetylornithine carbamoyltransferase [Terrimonas sp.]
MQHFLSVKDADSIESLLAQALYYKKNPFADQALGKGKRLGCLFLNPSMRTRLSTQIAAQQLGMEAIIFNVGAEGWAMEFEEGAIMNGTTVEHVKDAAPILGQYFDILALRTFPGLEDRTADYAENILNQFIKYAGVPILSLESATRHPLQSLADLLTIQEDITSRSANFTNRKPRVVLTWAPHIKPLPQCVANSFAEWVNAWGKADFVITHPPGMELEETFTKGAGIVYDQKLAMEGADFIYVKNWSSYQQYGKMAEGDTQSWMLTPERLAVTNQAKVMHCLPVRRNIELSDQILDSTASLVNQQAGNRVWAAQAVLKNLLQAHG